MKNKYWIMLFGAIFAVCLVCMLLPVDNDAATKAQIRSEDAVVTEISSALMGSDDFANYSARIPGVYFFLHTNNREKNLVKTNHNPAFDVDEEVLWKGVLAYVATARKFLN